MAQNSPEQMAPADVFYNEEEARKYTINTRMITIQEKMTKRALELLAIPKGKSKLILDIGCGSGISGSIVGSKGHMWIGTDISKAMLQVASEREVEGDVMHSDMGHGFGFRHGTFDGAISISAIQWLCSAEKSSQNPWKRLNHFFSSLYACLVKGARCAFQFYPSSPQQVEMITAAAMKNGFIGGLIVDFPNSNKARKYFLHLTAGYSKEIHDEAQQAIFKSVKARTEGEDYSSDEESGSDDDMDEEGMAKKQTAEEDWESDEDEGVQKKGQKQAQQVATMGNKRKSRFLQKAIKKQGRFKANGNRKNKEWIMKKKDRQRRQGHNVKGDSKYSGRKRPKF